MASEKTSGWALRSWTGDDNALLRKNLDAEIARLERVVASACAFLSTGGMVLSLYLLLAVSRPLGGALLAFSTLLAGWFLLVRTLLGRGVVVRLFQVVNPLVEISLPTAIIAIDFFTQGPRYALAMSVPLQFYGVFVLVAVLRLQSWVPPLVGIVGALQYLGAYALLIRPALSAELQQLPEFRADLVLMRAAVLALAGGAGAFVSAALRSAVGQAARTTRSEELFGKYRLDQELATGGMGVVYRATYCPEGGFRRPVALKRIHPHLAKQEQFVTSFRNEAELSARLPHANIVQVLDFGRIDDTYFLAMEFVDGCTLNDLYKRCRDAQVWMPPRLVAYIGREICEALHFAHRTALDDKGQALRIVHRDLSPPNVLLSKAGEVKVSDFGIARSLGASQELVTRTMAGKAPYMAPEQALGEGLDERCDLFAVGVILWELLCNRRLFFRENDGASLIAVLQEEIAAPSSVRIGLDGAWDRFLQKALARPKAQRFQSAAEMRDALDEMLIAEGLPRPDELATYLATMPAAPVPDTHEVVTEVEALPKAG